MHDETAAVVGFDVDDVAALPPVLTVLRVALRLRRVQLGLAAVGPLVVVGVVGPLLAPHSPTAFVGMPYAGRGDRALLGTDYLGHDVLSRFLWGGRGLIVLALAATVLGVVIGVTIGLTAAYGRNPLDDVLMRGMDVLLAFPQILLVLVAIATVGARPWVVVTAVAATTMPRVARIARGAALPVVEQDFVAAAEALGESRRRILFAEIAPNVLSALTVEASLRLTYAIGLIAALAFLGFTPTVGGADWGLMIEENQAALVVQPWSVVLPAVAIALLTVGSGLIGDGLSRAAIGMHRDSR